MSETLKLTFGEEEYESTPENTTLFTFLGRTALNGVDFENSRVNHIFFQKGETDESLTGAYMFHTEDNDDTFNYIANHILENDYPMVLNRRDVPACDMEAYMNMLERQAIVETPDNFEIPEEWLGEGQS